MIHVLVEAVRNISSAVEDSHNKKRMRNRMILNLFLIFYIIWNLYAFFYKEKISLMLLSYSLLYNRI